MTLVSEGMNERRLRLAQAATGALFAAFLTVHLFNTAVALRGAEAYDATQASLRRAYQVPVVEVLLVLTPALLHAGLAVTSMWRRRTAAPAPLAWPTRLHRWSGRFLLLVFVGHVGATRAPALLAGAAPGFAGVAFTFKWVPAWFWPYYAALALAGWFHLVLGLGMALPPLGVRAGGALLRRPVRVALLTVGAVALLAGVVTFGTADASVMESPYARWWRSR